jgi:hypothetical protein
MMFKKIIPLVILFLTVMAECGDSGKKHTAATPTWTPKAGYVNTPLDASDPVAFYGDQVGYMNEYITLGAKTIYIDGSLSDEVVAKYSNVYNSFITAAAAFQNGTAAEPMRVLIAPWVYWIDDRTGTWIAGSDSTHTLYGMTFNITALKLEGLNQTASNVVICGNRGLNAGASGNWTLFNITGNDLNISNLTLANYCNVDLVYPLKTDLNVSKRSSSITQAQLMIYSGDRAIAQNVRFVSRLNLVSLSGGTRTLYNKCHFESTDDSINGGTAVYLNCDFDCYGKKPAYSLSGAIFLNCDFRSHVDVESDGMQYIAKATSPYGTIVDGRFITDNSNIKLGWSPTPVSGTRCYQYNVTLNGKSVLMSSDYAGVSVQLENYPNLLKAYKLTSGSETIYNTYNLLRGSDDWDPMGVKSKVQALVTSDLDVTNLPIRMTASATPTSLETGSGSTATTSYAISRLTSATALDTMAISAAGSLTWSVPATDQAGFVSLATSVSNSNNTVVTPTNSTYADESVIVEGVSTLGLHAAVAITSQPAQMAAPTFSAAPSITLDSTTGKLTVNYTLSLPNSALIDESVITWYRCTDAVGSGAVAVLVSRLDNPEKVYTLGRGDVDYYLMAEVAPKHNVSPAGISSSTVYSTAIAAGNVKNSSTYTTDFQSFPSISQTSIQPGFWTVDGYRPVDKTQPLGSMPSQTFDTTCSSVGAFVVSNNSWSYAKGQDNAALYGLLQTSRGARLMYTPANGTYGNMSMTLILSPEKTVGQGFGSAGQYMDIGIKFDPSTLTGYALRIERISTYSNAVCIDLVQYLNGTITKLTNTGGLVLGSSAKGVSAFRSDCTIVLDVTGTTFTGKVSCSTDPLIAHLTAGYLSSVDLSATITPNNYGGILIHHTGTTSAGNRTLLRNLSVEWK